VKRGRVRVKAKIMELFAILGVLGFVVFVINLIKRKEDDAAALEWATRREPLVFISEHAFDETVEKRANEAREKLKQHGNKFLSDKDVWVFVYRVHVPIIGALQNANHAQWQEAVLRDVLLRREQWRQHKVGFIQNEAGRVFANQVQ